MAGTVKGGKKAALANYAKYGQDFYARIGKIGGRNGRGNKGFATNPALAVIAGRKGGMTSKRGPAKDASTNDKSTKSKSKK